MSKSCFEACCALLSLGFFTPHAQSSDLLEDADEAGLEVVVVTGVRVMTTNSRVEPSPQPNMIASSIELTAGVENLLDNACQDYLGGYNRVAGSDVPMGERLYSKGRNYYIRLNASW